MKCTSLEHTVETLAGRSPTVVRVASRSREDARMTEECKRKVGVRCCTLACCTYMMYSHLVALYAVSLLLFFINVAFTVKHLMWLSPLPYHPFFHCRMTF